MKELLSRLDSALLSNLKAHRTAYSKMCSQPLDPAEETRMLRKSLASCPAGSDRPLTASEGAEALNGWVYKVQMMRTPGGVITMKDVREAHKAVCDKFGASEGKCLLQRFATESVEALFIGMYQRFMAFVNATMTYNAPPSASWSGDSDFNLRPTYPKLFNKDDDL